MTNTETLILRCVPPFDFNLSVMIFSNGDRSIRKYQDGKYWQVVRLGDTLVLVTMKALGTVDDPKISVELRSDHKLSEAEKEKAKQTVSAILSLDLDLKPFYEHAKKDRILTEIIQRLRGLKIPTTPTVFEALIDSITEQQISLNVAHGLERKLIKTFGKALRLDGEVYYAYPVPRELASATLEQLRRCGLSGKKAEYIKEVSKMVVDGKLDLEGFKRCDDVQEIMGELDKIRGIGVWTAELTIARGMRKLDVVPADDLGLRRIISHHYCGDRKISGTEARKVSEKWGKWKGLVAFYLIIADVMENVSEAS
ncbi:MAG: DNA-3-methyladenine glycosylase [Candidatus Bathyarchaeia archaeon]